MHKRSLYNTLLNLSRNIFFYNQIYLKDTFESRLYLMFIHFSILMIIFKKKKKKFPQKDYDLFFQNIEYNLRELGFGDVAVNKKMKEFNQVLYDILLKLEIDQNKSNNFNISRNLIYKYFSCFKDNKDTKYPIFESYFVNFYNYCFELPLDNMVKDSKNFNYGCS